MLYMIQGHGEAPGGDLFGRGRLLFDNSSARARARNIRMRTSGLAWIKPEVVTSIQ